MPAAPGGGLREGLEEVHILPFGMLGRVLEELSKFVQDEKQACPKSRKADVLGGHFDRLDDVCVGGATRSIG